MRRLVPSKLLAIGSPGKFMCDGLHYRGEPVLVGIGHDDKAATY